MPAGPSLACLDSAIPVARRPATIHRLPARPRMASQPRQCSPAADGLPAGIPRQLGKYRLLHRFARGGMANLYLGQFVGTDRFRKLVAVKIIHEQFSEDPEFIEMFIDEAQLVAGISHPNVVHVHELGSVGGRHFMTMEYVHGECLTDLVCRVRIPDTVGCRVVADVAAGLHAAHELRDADGTPLQVVHRDISPHNVLVSYDGAVKLIDFGVASSTASLHVSRSGSLKGKFAYMSPEQVRSEPLDRRSDIFSLGIVLYEITTRRRLFRGSTETEMVQMVLDKPIPPPSVLRDDYPSELEQIVLRALSRRREQRYQTAEQMQEALERFILGTGAPVLPRQIGQMMHATFAEQIASKEELRRAAESGLLLDAVGREPSASQEAETVGPPRTREAASLARGRDDARRWRARAMAALALLAAGALLLLGVALAPLVHLPDPPPAPNVVRRGGRAEQTNVNAVRLPAASTSDDNSVCLARSARCEPARSAQSVLTPARRGRRVAHVSRAPSAGDRHRAWPMPPDAGAGPIGEPQARPGDPDDDTLVVRPPERKRLFADPYP